MTRQVTHIIRFFAPTIDGVGDYALNLARPIFEDNSDPAPLGFGHEILNWNNVEAYPIVAPVARAWHYRTADWPVVAKRNAEAIA